MNTPAYTAASQRAVSQLLRCERDSVPHTMMMAAANASPVPITVIERIIMCTVYDRLDPAIRRRAIQEPYLSTVASAIWTGAMALTPGY